MEDSSPDWNDIQREYMEDRDQRADISEEEARARRQLESVQRRLEEERRRAHEAPPQPQPGPQIQGPDFDQVIGPPPMQPDALTTTTQWNDNTTLVPGQIGDLNVTTEANQPAYYSYTSPAIDKEAIKEALREVLIEMREEDCNFISWLQMKYMTIPVVQKPKKKRRRKRNVNDRQSISPSGAGIAGAAIGNTINTLGSAGGGTISIRSDVRTGARTIEEFDSPPDQGSR